MLRIGVGRLSRVLCVRESELLSDKRGECMGAACVRHFVVDIFSCGGGRVVVYLAL